LGIVIHRGAAVCLDNIKQRGKEKRGGLREDLAVEYRVATETRTEPFKVGERKEKSQEGGNIC